MYSQRVLDAHPRSRGGPPGEKGVADFYLYTPVNDANIDNTEGSRPSRIFYKFYACDTLTLIHKQYFLKAIGSGAKGR